MASRLFDASVVITFPAEDIEQADEIIDELIEDLEERGFQFETAAIGESVEIDE